MPTLDAIIARLDSMLLVTQTQIEREMERTALDAVAIVTQRITETGKDAEGRAFKPYTPRYEQYKRGAVGTAKREGAERREARKTAKATAEKPVGRYRGFVDFTLSGRMLSNAGLQDGAIGITQKSSTLDRVRVVVAGRTEETRAKMEGNDNSRPGWFRLSREEQLRLAARSKVRMEKWATEFLNR